MSYHLPVRQPLPRPFLGAGFQRRLDRFAEIIADGLELSHPPNLPAKAMLLHLEIGWPFAAAMLLGEREIVCARVERSGLGEGKRN
jgi:hypothetical protein